MRSPRRGDAVRGPALLHRDDDRAPTQLGVADDVIATATRLLLVSPQFLVDLVDDVDAARSAPRIPASSSVSGFEVGKPAKISPVVM
jgi:hypothetical protein